MIKFFGPNKTQAAPISAGTQVTGFSSAYFLFGDPTGSNVGVGYNRTISFSTDSESARTANTGPRISQGAGGFSSTNIYHINGYQSGLVTVKNKILAASDTQSAPTISLTVERRGATINLPSAIVGSRFYFMGGYSDSLAQYRADNTYITTSTDTATNATSITAARHVSVGMYEGYNVYILGGYTTGGGTTNTIYKYVMNTDTPSNTSITESTNMAQGYSFSNASWAYRANGATVTNTSNIKLTYSTETKSAGSNSPEGSLQLFQGVCSATATVGYVWTGYRNTTLNRAYHKLTFSTETWTNNSYTTGDTNSGWITSGSGA
jgi:hypothetical protein